MNHYDDNKIRRKKVSSKNTASNKDNNRQKNYENNKSREGISYREHSYDKSHQSSNNTIKRTENRNAKSRKIARNKKNRAKQRMKRIFKKIMSIILVIGLMFTIIGGVGIYSIVKELPPITKESIQKEYLNTDTISIKDIPKELQNAIVAIEDERFYEHNGVDIKSLFRAVINNITTDTVQGGSTLDMQVSKNLLTSADKTIKRKIKDIYYAWKMNQIMTKEEILEAYLNNIYLGKGAYGVKQGARVYFGKEVKDLTLGESAMLAGITNNPSKYMSHSQAKKRQEIILKKMFELGYINESQYKQGINDEALFKSEIE